MARRTDEVTLHSYRGHGDAELAYREMGQGRPLILLHGYLSSALETWVRYGHAKQLAARGHRVIMPDLRSHGDSTKSREPEAYPPDVLTDDGLALVEHLKLREYDLGGYSQGGRTALRMMVRGASPERAIVAGTGVDEITSASGRGQFFRNILLNPGTFEVGSIEWRTEIFLKESRADPVALLQVLETEIDTPADALTRIHTPTLVLAGEEDRRTVPALAAALPRARFAVVPGDHLTAVTHPEAMGAAIADFLTGAPLAHSLH
jgi:pimeloyl-ACP methyl ester carboxylesterase